MRALVHNMIVQHIDSETYRRVMNEPPLRLIKPVEAAILVDHIATLAAPATGSAQPADSLPTTAT